VKSYPARSLAGAVFCLFGCGRGEPAEPSLEPKPAQKMAASARAEPEPAPPTTPAVATAAGVPIERPVTAAPRVYAKTRFVWIRPEPDASKEWIGYLWTGGSAPLKSSQPVYGPGCRYWYAVEPQGYVCVDGQRATLDENDPGYVAVRPYAADLGSPWPHRYAESLGTKLTNWLPGSPLAFPELPVSLHEARRRLKARSTVAYSTEVSVGDRQWLLSADFLWLPKERVTPYEKVEFKGVELGRDKNLPLAFFRSKDRPKYVRQGESFVESGRHFARLSHVELTGERFEIGDERFLRTREAEFWIKETDAVIPTPQPLTPWGTPVDAPGNQAEAAPGAVPPKGRGTWIEVAVRPGWLIAYEGQRPVFATLISPGRGGDAKPGKDPLETMATPLGSFPISGKFATATMEAPGELFHSDVPWSQNFSGPYVLHSAYWHNDWGDWKSGGCVNVSPIDGRRLFEFTEPVLPPGWHGVRWLPWQGAATTIVIHR
jgi:hypothetical protein